MTGADGERAVPGAPAASAESVGSAEWRGRVLDACAVSDALDRLGVPGRAVSLPALSVPQRICGPAMTVHLGPAWPGVTSARHLATAAIEALAPGGVIVVAHGGRVDAAGWGGLLSLSASQQGAAGVVVDGACRDVDEAAEIGLPVYGRAAIPTTARGRVMEIGWNCPVSFAGVPVAPGDVVVADRSGVVFVPVARVGEVLDLAEQIYQREQEMAAAIRSGVPASSVMDGSYETLAQGGAGGGTDDG